ncbi:hypothetical protein T11_8814 [Trichinella zimbabwensis]|uniref:Uncharacterized protein n=1 Tax=Trichinella zimbabwensis TaxID=268475 RepID=A0A0V1HS59_9BILA|nr:hypothetical protein T11_8814 [Trichinella zimbabwensis]
MAKPSTISSVSSDELKFASHEMENLDVVFMDSNLSESAFEMFYDRIHPRNVLTLTLCGIVEEKRSDGTCLTIRITNLGS